MEQLLSHSLMSFIVFIDAVSRRTSMYELCTHVHRYILP